MSVPKAPFGCTKATVVPRLPGPGLLVDHLEALGLQPVERLGAGVDAVPHMVEALALALEVLRHGGVVPHRREELHVGVGDAEQRFFDAVALDDLTVLDSTP